MDKTFVDEISVSTAEPAAAPGLTSGHFSFGFAMDAALAPRLAASSGGEFDDDGAHDEGDGPAGGTGTIVKPDTRTKTPALYRVLLLNDDFTPMEFVVHVLQKFFGKEYTEATRIMLQVHHKGAGVAGVFSYEIAETKVYQVNQYARQNRHPLKCTMETV